MSDGEYLKCPCKECGNNIEFPVSSKRDTISCPHCGQWTELLVPDEETEEKKDGPNYPALALWIALPLILLAGFVYFIHSKNIPEKKSSAPSPIVKVAPKSVVKPVTLVTNPSPTITNKEIAQTPPAAPRPKSSADLKTGNVTIEKAKEGKLTYAVGVVKNDSDYQRFGVRIELDLISLQGTKIGATQDYISILEPHKEWHFHGLVTEPKAVAARLASLKEEP